MSYDRTYRKTTTTTNRGRRPLYAPPPPPGGHNRQHSVLGYWVPLITIGTIAVGGLAAWIWAEREHEDDDLSPHDKPPRPPTGMGGPYPTQGAQPYPGPPQSGGPPPGVVPPQDPSTHGMPPPVGAEGQVSYQGEASSYYDSTETQSRDVRDDRTFIGRMTGAIKRTPSPQQFFDSASKQVMGGIAAAGTALGSIMEVDSNAGQYSERRSRDQSRLREEREGFSDHERWSEEADERNRITVVEKDSEKRAKDAAKDKGKGSSKRAVAVVVSADVPDEQGHEGVFTEHGSILSHLPTQHDPARNELFVLIHAPGLKQLPSPDYTPGRAGSSLGGSYSEIDTPAHTPGSELQSISPRIDAQPDFNQKQFDALWTQALSLVSNATQILPFTTKDGYVHMLRHLAPQLVYVSDTLSGREGETIAQLKGWVGHTVLVVGDDGHGGLADTETETEDEQTGDRRASKWYEHSSFVGLGKEVDLVDSTRVGDDWARRVNAKE
ncbi:hypothetical protein DOTSEDRAFT_75123 [Dothistroma septosporum NZE10]|uniref:Peroxin 22-like protein n=1 Tax=Dothistroma septosporum (strain NZE10 / CBS 128990) TaxID=675120 RepID=M2XIK3_DOTSN|nr:hypothetical protein DOTSEDRAFT_75123 [Dothistroma septosporum NZE10]